METTELIASLAREGELLALAAERAGSDAPVPTCPGWRTRDLVRHVSRVHRWAGTLVAERHASYVPDSGDPDLDGDALVRHYREGLALLVAALTEAPDDLECWTFLPADGARAFWARRQHHETTVHRVDAESALAPVGAATPVAPALAADGIDELLLSFHGRERSRVRTAAPRTLRVRATDTGDAWTARLSPDAPPVTARGEEGTADCELSGTAHDLYLYLWNRLPADALKPAGDAEVVRTWRETSAVTWS
ncbi:maleylpyruvate isomerase family mycothiol-dependent enzyme [Streptomyces sp. NPDC001941]|uniref:maleylpyruvate isomerase family mycothiol-dependent enzyme n=1 Tax=Streptomyces sp. NPDC001941 TaxID=3154659 RepID=UPI00332E6D7E